MSRWPLLGKHLYRLRLRGLRTTTPALFDGSLEAREQEDSVGLLSLSLSSTTLRFPPFVLRGSVRAREFVRVWESYLVRCNKIR